MGVENSIRRQAIAKEIRNNGPTYMNNFYNRVPFPNVGQEDIRFLNMAILPGFGPDIPFSDFYEADSMNWIGEERHSDLFWSSTPRQYFELIDQVLAEEIGFDRIREIQSLLKQPKKKEQHYPTMMDEACESAYLKLIEMGFTWRNLSA